MENKPMPSVDYLKVPTCDRVLATWFVPIFISRANLHDLTIRLQTNAVLFIYSVEDLMTQIGWLQVTQAMQGHTTCQALYTEVTSPCVPNIKPLIHYDLD